MAQVDLQQLAIERTAADREPRSAVRWGTRYGIPLVLIACFVALLAWSAQDWILPAQSVQVQPVRTTTSSVRSAGTPLFQAAGWVEPRPTPIRVAALSPGVIEELLVVEDQPVKKGDPVAHLVRDDNQLAYEMAQADLALRQAEVEHVEANLQAARTRREQPVHLEAALAEADAQVSRIENQLESLPFELKRAEAKRQFAKQDHDRKVASGNAVSELTVDRAISDLQTSDAMVDELTQRKSTLEKERIAWTKRRDALKTQLDLLVDEIENEKAAEARLKSAIAQRKQAEVALAQAKLALDRMIVRAPVDGRIYQLLSPPGSHLGVMPKGGGEADSSTVVSMYRPDRLQIRVDVRFEDIPKVSLGQSVRINNPALTSPIRGEVLYVSSEADIQKNTLQVKVALENPPPFFKPEMLVDVTFLAPELAGNNEAETSEQRISIPLKLVINGESKVWIANQSKKAAQQRSVELGAESSDGWVEVRNGLTIADRLIAPPWDGLTDGTKIRVVGETENL